ncbi:MAG TPA: hypothetical protein VJ180_04275 [Pyrinomonadaceae bacterium]|nr:hypothetical protein [Pyrinomonadaceae bacterium]
MKTFTYTELTDEAERTIKEYMRPTLRPTPDTNLHRQRAIGVWCFWVRVTNDYQADGDPERLWAMMEGDK